MAPQATESEPVGQEIGVTPSTIAPAEAAAPANAQVHPSRSGSPHYQDTLQEPRGNTTVGLKSEFHILPMNGVADILYSPIISHNLNRELPSLDTSAPPAYNEKHDQIDISQDGFDTQAKVTG